MPRALTFLIALFPCLLGLGELQAAPFSIAFHYGSTLPADGLRAHDIVVVEPDHGHQPGALGPDTDLFAYVSVGEVHPQRAYLAEVPAALKRKINTDWGSVVIDVSQPVWAEFMAERIVGPLWQRGYRGFFLDTLDAYRLLDDVDPAAAQRGLEALIQTLAKRYPGIRLIFNRGFELLPAVHSQVFAVAAESVHRGWSAGQSRYVAVPEADRRWLLARFDEVRQRYGLPVIGIDYLPASALDEARTLARRMLAEEIIPWIAEPSLTTLGTGANEALPRRVLVVYDANEASAINYTNAHRYIEMPLNYLGYVADYVTPDDALPERLDPRIHAGIVTWMTGGIKRGERLHHWLQTQIDAGTKVAIFDDFGFELGHSAAARLGLRLALPPTAPLTLSQSDPLIGFEMPPRPRAGTLLPITAPGGIPLATLTDTNGQTYHPAAIMPWGGYLLDAFAVVELPGVEGQSRWGADPFAFLQRALRLPARPVPDPTTASGRRLLMVHIDGDGFPSLGEFPGSPLAAQVLLDDVLKRYRIPHAMSVIEAEVSPQGLYPALATRLEGIARQMFALAHVEIASHTYSHPFKWRKVFDARDDDRAADYHLDIPGYTPSPEREILGSIDYIRSRLAPAGKPVRLLLWSGNAAPDADTLKLITDHNLLDMNGGNTTMSRRRPTVAAVSPIGVHQGPYFQPYAPVMNENVYTSDWTGPFYGFRDVIDTFKMTGEPRRLKPINIYYHTYSASKVAALKALHTVYDWALAQPTQPVFPSDYIAMAHNFNTLSLARALDDPDTLHIRNADALHNLRLPPDFAAIDLANSPGLAGTTSGPDGRFATLASSRASLRTGATAADIPSFVSANGRLTHWQGHPKGIDFALKAHTPLSFTLSHPSDCRLQTGRGPVVASGRSGLKHHYHLDGTNATFTLRCPG
ncbi:bifunctional glycoside hydrolase 114/ polysaccharide deacetylase family protein [Denitromonas halophila]|uniref:Glycoside-hydrolase family GH114 TIM-barrel domain-containing protein n=1 Tax=Denitromonas halophila TaxID=1629404 RepID=A0A557QER0_9RHOO|nr:bifunctional glycoside hydrolase 114/ polysaccharide deacetylase family protein [Denitromonas halophila]TVO51408.1 hypothetical protein FHP91_19745 [Denitromonas halophila]